jgi:hypothetical protein
VKSNGTLMPSQSGKVKDISTACARREKDEEKE